jgi:hypothetical protein
MSYLTLSELKTLHETAVKTGLTAEAEKLAAKIYYEENRPRFSVEEMQEFYEKHGE